MRQPKSQRLSRKPKWISDAINRLRDDVLAFRPVAGTGTSVTESDSGTAINAKQGQGGGGGTNTYFVVINGALYTDDFTSAGPTAV